MKTFNAQLSAIALPAPIHSSFHCERVSRGDQVRPVTTPAATAATPANVPAQKSGPSGNNLTASQKSPSHMQANQRTPPQNGHGWPVTYNKRHGGAPRDGALTTDD